MPPEPLTPDQFRHDVIRPLYTRAADLYAALPDFRFRWVFHRRQLRELAQQVRQLRQDVRGIDASLATIAEADGSNLNKLAASTLLLTIVGRERDSAVALIDTLDRAVSQRAEEANVYAGIALSMLSIAIALLALVISYASWQHPYGPLPPAPALPSSASSSAAPAVLP